MGQYHWMSTVNPVIRFADWAIWSGSFHLHIGLRINVGNSLKKWAIVPVPRTSKLLLTGQTKAIRKTDAVPGHPAGSPGARPARR